MFKAINGALAIGCVAAILLSGCAGTDEKKVEGPPAAADSQQKLLELADEWYREARGRLDAADFQSAVIQYGALRSRFPFTEYATQAHAELVYALYRNYQHEQAITDADRFLREHPRHDLVPYVRYLRGLVFFERGNGFFDGLPFVDASRRDTTDARRAFDEFSLLTQRYPDSPYVGDAHERMIFLRNRIAEHEMHVVRFYVERGAYVAAARRAQQVIAEYPGAPASYEALILSERSYRALGLDQQADATLELIEANREQVAAALAEDLPEVSPRRWYKPWTWFSGGDTAATDAASAPPPIG